MIWITVPFQIVLFLVLHGHDWWFSCCFIKILVICTQLKLFMLSKFVSKFHIIGYSDLQTQHTSDTINYDNDNVLHKASSGHSSSCWVQEAQSHIPHTSNHPRSPPPPAVISPQRWMAKKVTNPHNVLWNVLMICLLLEIYFHFFIYIFELYSPRML